MKKMIIFLLIGVSVLLGTNATSKAQEFAIAAGSDNTFSRGSAYGGMNCLVAVMGDASSQSSINAQLVAPGGALIGPRISLGATGVRMGAKPVFDGTNYFLVWCESDGNLKGQFITTAGVLAGDRVTITENVSVERPGLFDVVWAENSYYVVFVKSNGYLYGQQVSSSGSLMGNQIQISSNYAREISIAYDGINFLTAWVEAISSTDKDIFGQFVSKTGSLVGSNFLIDGGPNYSDNPTSLAFDGSRYLLAFHEAQSTENNWFLLGRFISKSGTIEETITICDTSKAPSFPSVAFSNNNYLITWTQESDFTLMGRFFTKSGIPVDAPFVIFGPLNGKMPVGGVCSGGDQFLAIATKTNADFTDGDVYGRFIPYSATGINDHEGGEPFFSLFPNPAANSVTLNVSNLINAEVALNIYTIAGELIHSEVVQQNRKQLNIENLKNGIYTVELKSKEWTEKRNLLIQR